MPVFHAVVNGREISVVTGSDGDFIIDGVRKRLDVQQVSDSVYSVLLDGRSVTICLSGSGEQRSFLVNGKRVTLSIESDRDRLVRSLAKSGLDEGRPLDVRAPMPALVSSLPVVEGDSVAAGQPLVVLEAMKMENEVRAHHDGVIRKVFVKKGETVEKGALLLRIERSVKT